MLELCEVSFDDLAIISLEQEQHAHCFKSKFLIYIKKKSLKFDKYWIFSLSSQCIGLDYCDSGLPFFFRKQIPPKVDIMIFYIKKKLQTASSKTIKF